MWCFHDSGALPLSRWQISYTRTRKRWRSQRADVDTDTQWSREVVVDFSVRKRHTYDLGLGILYYIQLICIPIQYHIRDTGVFKRLLFSLSQFPRPAWLKWGRSMPLPQMSSLPHKSCPRLLQRPLPHKSCWWPLPVAEDWDWLVTCSIFCHSFDKLSATEELRV